jgi:hypothetical protein
MVNKLSKNLEKSGETAIMASIASVLTFIINRCIVDVPADVSAAMVVVLTAASAGVYNWLTHRTVKH